MDDKKTIKLRIIEKAKKHREDFLKFLVVGLSATFVTLFLLWLFTERFGIYYLLSAILSTQISIFWNFFWQDKWTFANRDMGKSYLGRLANFEAIYITSQVANIFILFVLTEYLKIYHLFSMGIAIGITFMYNYFMNHKFTFKKK